jgi:hypothetical protein
MICERGQVYAKASLSYHFLSRQRFIIVQLFDPTQSSAAARAATKLEKYD